MRSMAVCSVTLITASAIVLAQTAVTLPMYGQVGSGGGQAVQAAPAPPAPSDLLKAKKIFVGNEGASPEIYTRFVAELNAWGRYTLVDSPAQADVIFGLREEPLSVLVLEPSSKIVLTTVSASYVPVERDQDKEATMAAQNLVSAIKQLVRTPLSPQETAQITPPQVGKHQGLIVTIVILGSLAIAGGVVAALHGRGH
jgi:hypothetical protein